MNSSTRRPSTTVTQQQQQQLIPLPSRDSLITLYTSEPRDLIPDPEKKTTEVLGTFHNDRRGLLLCMLAEKYGLSKLLEHGVVSPHQLVVNKRSLLDLYVHEALAQKRKEFRSKNSNNKNISATTEEDFLTVTKQEEATFKSDIDAVIELFEDDAEALLKAMETKYSFEAVIPFMCPQLEQIAHQRQAAKEKKGLANNKNEETAHPKTERRDENNENSNNFGSSLLPPPSPAAVGSSSTPQLLQQQPTATFAPGDLVQSGTSHFSPSMAKRLGIPVSTKKQQQQHHQNTSALQKQGTKPFTPPATPENTHETSKRTGHHHHANNKPSAAAHEHLLNDDDEDSDEEGEVETTSTISSSDSNHDEEGNRLRNGAGGGGAHRADTGLTGGNDINEEEGEHLNATAISRFQSMSAAAASRKLAGLNRTSADKHQEVKDMLTQYFSREGMPKKTPEEIEFLAFKYADSKGELLDKLRRQYGDVAMSLAGFSTSGGAFVTFGTPGGKSSANLSRGLSNQSLQMRKSPGGSTPTNEQQQSNSGANSPLTLEKSPTSATLGKKSVGFLDKKQQEEEEQQQQQGTLAALSRQQKKQREEAHQKAQIEMRAALLKMTDSQADRYLGGEDPTRRVPHFIELFASPSGRILYGYWSTMCLRIGTTGMKRLHYSLARFSPRIPIQASAALACTFENELFVDGEPASMVKRKLLRRDHQMNQMKEQLTAMIQQQQQQQGMQSDLQSVQSNNNNLNSSFNNRSHSTDSSSLQQQQQNNAKIGSLARREDSSSSLGSAFSPVVTPPTLANNNTLNSSFRDPATSIGGGGLNQHQLNQRNRSFTMSANNNSPGSGPQQQQSSLHFFGSGVSFFEDWEAEAQHKWSCFDLSLTDNNNNITSETNSSLFSPVAPNKNSSSSQSRTSTSTSPVQKEINTTAFRVSTAAEQWANTIMRDIIRFREDVTSIVGRILRDESRERTTIQLRAWKHQRLLMEVTDRAFDLVINETLVEAERRRRKMIADGEDVDFRGLTLFFYRNRDVLPERMTSLDFLSAVSVRRPIVANGGEDGNNNSNVESSFLGNASFYANNLKMQGQVDDDTAGKNDHSAAYTDSNSHHQSPQQAARSRMISHFQDLSRAARNAAEQHNFQGASFAFRSTEEEIRLRHLITHGEKLAASNSGGDGRGDLSNPYQTADRQAEARVSRMQALFGVSSDVAKQSFVRATKKVSMVSRFAAAQRKKLDAKKAEEEKEKENDDVFGAMLSDTYNSGEKVLKQQHHESNSSDDDEDDSSPFSFSPGRNRNDAKKNNEEKDSVADDEQQQHNQSSSSPSGLTPFISPARKRGDSEKKAELLDSLFSPTTQQQNEHAASVGLFSASPPKRNTASAEDLLDKL